LAAFDGRDDSDLAELAGARHRGIGARPKPPDPLQDQPGNNVPTA